MKAKRYKRYNLEIPVLKFGISFIFEKDYKDESIAICEVADENGTNPMITFDATRDIPRPTIVHELIHALLSEFSRRGFKTVNIWDDELLPYSMAYCYSKVVRYCKKNNIKLKDELN